MHFGFALGLSDRDLWNIDFLDIHLDFLDTDISSKPFACLHKFFKTSSKPTKVCWEVPFPLIFNSMEKILKLFKSRARMFICFLCLVVSILNSETLHFFGKKYKEHTTNNKMT